MQISKQNLHSADKFSVATSNTNNQSDEATNPERLKQEMHANFQRFTPNDWILLDYVQSSEDQTRLLEMAIKQLLPCAIMKNAVDHMEQRMPFQGMSYQLNANVMKGRSLQFLVEADSIS